MISIQYLLIFWMMHLTIFSFLNFEQKLSVKKLNVVIFIVFLILDLFRYMQDGYHSVQPYDVKLGLGAVIIVFVYSLQGFKSLLVWTVVIISLIIASLISHISSGFLLPIIGIDGNELFENPMVSTIGIASGLVLFKLLNFIINKFKLQINVYGLTKKEGLIIILFLVMFGFYVDNMYSIINQHTYTFRFVLNVLSLLVGVVPVYGAIYIISQKNYIRYVESREQQQDLLIKEERIHYDKMRERDEEMRAFKHDIDAELDYIKKLTQDGELDEVFNHIDEMKGITDKVVRPITQSTGLNTVDPSWYNLITNKEYEDIECDWLGKVPGNLVISNREIVKLFSNLLKNAFEAAINSKGDKYVKVEINDQPKQLTIIVKNSHSNDVKESGEGIFITSKLKNEEHGIGTHIVKDIIAKYDGLVRYTYDDHEFIVKIVFGSHIYKKNWL